jgi:FtsP/CotA-like multicopper oxidase with cupredoxin domain
MQRKTLVFTHVMLESQSSTVSLDPHAALSYATLSSWTGSTLPINAVYTNSSIKDAWFVNGQYQPVNAMHPGEWQIFDMTCSSGDRLLEIEIRTAIGRNYGSQACEMRLLALDGVYLSSTRTGTYVDHLMMVAAGRATIAVRCASVGVYYFQAASPVTSTDALYHKLSGLDTASVQLLMKLDVSGTSMSTMADPPTDLSSIPRPAYMADLRPLSITNGQPRNWSVAVDEIGCCDQEQAGNWLGMGSDCTLECFGNGDCAAKFGSDYSIYDLQVVKDGRCSFKSFPGMLGDNRSSYRVVLTKGDVSELTLWGRGVDSHPVHIHGIHFQLSSFVSAVREPIPLYHYFG